MAREDPVVTDPFLETEGQYRRVNDRYGDVKMDSVVSKPRRLRADR